MILLLSLLPTASAQEEVCDSIYSASELRQSIGEANGLIEKGEISRGMNVLGKSRDLVHCMEGLVPVADLAALADVYARGSFFSQDAEESIRWGRLVFELEPDHDWGPIDTEHPIRTAIVEAGDLEFFPSEKGFVVERKGSVFIDGRFAPKPEAKRGMPHLVQVFNGKGHLIDAYWQDGNTFPERMLGEPSVLKQPNYFDPETATIKAKGKPPSDLPGREPTSPVVYAGVGLVGASVVLYALAGGSHAAFTCDSRVKDTCPSTPEKLTQLRSRTNGLVMGAGLTFAAGVGLGVTGILTEEPPGLRFNGRF